MIHVTKMKNNFFCSNFLLIRTLLLTMIISSHQVVKCKPEYVGGDKMVRDLYINYVINKDYNSV